MASIKIGRETFEIQKGDYILDNGACLQFCGGNGRILKRKGFDSFSSLLIPKSLYKDINLKEMVKKETVSNFTKQPLIKYFFNV